jgi:saccharopine dehydrogenase-like NADP-dependent oxidoreductase
VRLGYGFAGGPPAGTLGATGIPLAIGAEMIMSGEIKQRGVLAPESCVQPMPFIEKYVRYWENPPQGTLQALREIREVI